MTDAGGSGTIKVSINTLLLVPTAADWYISEDKNMRAYKPWTQVSVLRSFLGQVANIPYNPQGSQEKIPVIPFVRRRGIWHHLTPLIRARDKYTCQRCGVIENKDGPHFHIHHINPLSGGGLDHPSNLQTLCPSCHIGDIGHSVRSIHAGLIKKQQLPESPRPWKILKKKSLGHPKTTDRIRIETLMAEGHAGRDLLDVAERMGIARERTTKIAETVRRARGPQAPGAR